MRSKGTGSIYKRIRNGKTVWEGRVSAGYDPGTGKRITKYVYGSTQRETQKKMNELMNRLEKGTYREPSRITVAEWCDEYIETFARDTLKPLTVTKYEATIRNHIKPAIGALKLKDVAGMDIQKMINAKTRAGLNPKTVKDIAGLTAKIFKTAYMEELIDANPCTRLRTPKASDNEIRPLAQDEIPRFLDAIEGQRFRNAMAIQLFAGLREGELLGLAWKNVDLKTGELRIAQQLQKHGKEWEILPATKNSRIRTVQLPDIAIPYLRDEQLRQMKNRLAHASFWSNEDDLVFTNEIGELIHTNVYYKDFKAVAASIGRPDLRPHDLRHTAATIAIASGADIKSVQDLLGHATASFTLNVYAHSSEIMRKDTANKVDGFYQSIKK